MTCESIYDNIFVDCEFKANQQDILYVINYNDISYVQFDGFPISDIRTVKDHVDIVRLFLKPDSFIREIQCVKKSISAGYYEYELLYTDVFAHYINFGIYKKDSELKNILSDITGGRYVMIYNGEVYGLYSGMVLMKNEIDSERDNLNTIYDLEFETNDEETEPHLPHLYVGDISWLKTNHWILWDGWWDNTGVWMNEETWNYEI